MTTLTVEENVQTNKKQRQAEEGITKLAENYVFEMFGVPDGFTKVVSKKITERGVRVNVYTKSKNKNCVVSINTISESNFVYFDESNKPYRHSV